jgi:hypothetical protein
MLFNQLVQNEIDGRWEKIDYGYYQNDEAAYIAFTDARRESLFTHPNWKQFYVQEVSPFSIDDE